MTGCDQRAIYPGGLAEDSRWQATPRHRKTPNSRIALRRGDRKSRTHRDHLSLRSSADHESEWDGHIPAGSNSDDREGTGCCVGAALPTGYFPATLSRGACTRLETAGAPHLRALTVTAVQSRRSAGMFATGLSKWSASQRCRTGTKGSFPIP